MKIAKTYSTRPADVESRWHVFDATDVVLGRLATEISVLLQGKHKPTYARHVLTGDYVVVVNAARVKVTGAKTEQKMYRRHSHYPGALRETPMSKVLDTYPDRVIREAVRGMLPKNRLGRRMLRRLRVYAGATHPHAAQVKDMADVEVVAAPVQRDDAPAAEITADQVEDTAAVEAAAEPEEAAAAVEAAAEPVEDAAAVESAAEPVEDAAEVEAATEPEEDAAAVEAAAEPAEDAAAVESAAEPVEDAAAVESAEAAAEVESSDESPAEPAEDAPVAEAESPADSETTEEKR